MRSLTEQLGVGRRSGGESLARGGALQRCEAQGLQLEPLDNP